MPFRGVITTTKRKAFSVSWRCGSFTFGLSEKQDARASPGDLLSAGEIKDSVERK